MRRLVKELISQGTVVNEATRKTKAEFNEFKAFFEKGSYDVDAILYDPEKYDTTIGKILDDVCTCGLPNYLLVEALIYENRSQKSADRTPQDLLRKLCTMAIADSSKSAYFGLFCEEWNCDIDTTTVSASSAETLGHALDQALVDKGEYGISCLLRDMLPRRKDAYSTLRVLVKGACADDSKMKCLDDWCLFQKYSYNIDTIAYDHTKPSGKTLGQVLDPLAADSAATNAVLDFFYKHNKRTNKHGTLRALIQAARMNPSKILVLKKWHDAHPCDIDTVLSDPAKPTGENLGTYVDGLTIKNLSAIFGRTVEGTTPPPGKNSTIANNNTGWSSYLTKTNVALLGIVAFAAYVGYKNFWENNPEKKVESAAKAA